MFEFNGHGVGGIHWTLVLFIWAIIFSVYEEGDEGK